MIQARLLRVAGEPVKKINVAEFGRLYLELSSSASVILSRHGLSTYRSGNSGVGPNFHFDLRPDFFLDLIGTGQAAISVDGAGQMSMRTGLGAAQDGSDSHQVDQLDVLYQETATFGETHSEGSRPKNFCIYLDAHIGEPIPGSWPVGDRSSERYWINFVVKWDQFWDFYHEPFEPELVARFAEAIKSRVGVELTARPSVANRK